VSYIIQYPSSTGPIDIAVVVTDEPDWISVYPDRGRQPRRYTAPSFFGPFIESEQLVWPTIYPDKGRQLRRDIHAGPVSIKEDIVVVVEEGNLTQFPFHGREIRRDIHAGPSLPGLFIAEQLVWNPVYPDHVVRTRLSPNQQQFTTHDANFSVVPPVVVGQAVPGSRHRRRSRSRTIYREA